MRPGLDDKVLADWNGLMIAALVNAGIALRRAGMDRRWRARAFGFIATSMTQGRPARPFLARRAAAVSRAGLGLRRHDPRRAGAVRGDRRARLPRSGAGWQTALDAHYADADTGGYYLSADDADDLLLRPHSTADDATPNPNAVAAQNLVRLAVLSGDDKWRDKADRLLEGILSAAAYNLFCTWRC